jgi:hypothetical protein
MSSAEAAPRAPQPADDTVALTPSESEPLLGRPGDAIQKPDAPLIRNFWLGLLSHAPRQEIHSTPADPVLLLPLPR